ncbi:uncharacterized protein [Littorina saxatilis]|uniref:Uncharacterized protein n=1 Tax=Littorina saxatilis TaxID=31220 RepID=A0AAN9AVH3_9CAEN
MTKGSFVDRMKTKNFYIIIVFVVITSGTIWLLSYPSPTFQNIVTKTHKGFKNLPSNIQSIQSSHELTVNPLYLSRLGLGTDEMEPKEMNAAIARELGLPVVATSVEREKWKDLVTFMESVAKHMNGSRLVMFDLSTSEDTHTLLQKYCNTTWHCEVRKFEFEKYPSHVADLSLKSYRPICIQEILNEFGEVVWADSAEYFQRGNITAALKQARSVGLAAWTIEDPTSAITHPKMFEFFKTKKELFYFHRAVESSHIIISETDLVKKKIMLPWVKCALLEECINPTGAQNVGCNFVRKPRFKYSGCHYYDMSALNVILGPVFEFDGRAYAAKDAIFGNLVEDRLAAKNATDPLHRSRLKL